MTLYLLDGVELDLDQSHVDVTGVEWIWTGKRTNKGEPLMASGRGLSLDAHKAIPLSAVYHFYGPLIPIADDRPRSTASAWLPRRTPVPRDTAEQVSAA